MSLRFRKHEHLRKPAEFRRVYERRCAVSDNLLLIHGLRNDLAYSRLGMSVARKVGSAVTRNRLRRLYREAFRLSRDGLPVGVDLVLIPKSAKATLPELQASLVDLGQALQRKLARAEKSK